MSGRVSNSSGGRGKNARSGGSIMDVRPLRIYETATAVLQNSLEANIGRYGYDHEGMKQIVLEKGRILLRK